MRPISNNYRDILLVFVVFSNFKGFPTVVLILEHNIKVFVVVSMVSDGKKRCGRFFNLYH